MSCLPFITVAFCWLWNCSVVPPLHWYLNSASSLDLTQLSRWVCQLFTCLCFCRCGLWNELGGLSLQEVQGLVSLKDCRGSCTRGLPGLHRSQDIRIIIYLLVHLGKMNWANSSEIFLFCLCVRRNYTIEIKPPLSIRTYVKLVLFFSLLFILK